MPYDKESFLRGLAVGLTVWLPPEEKTVDTVSLFQQSTQTVTELECESEEDNAV